MAVPKYRPSSHRQGRRRRTHKLSLPNLVECEFCGADKKPHFVCPNCGKIGTKEKQQEKENKKAKDTKKETKEKNDKKTTKKPKTKNDSQKEKKQNWS